MQGEAAVLLERSGLGSLTLRNWGVKFLDCSWHSCHINMDPFGRRWSDGFDGDWTQFFRKSESPAVILSPKVLPMQICASPAGTRDFSFWHCRAIGKLCSVRKCHKHFEANSKYQNRISCWLQGELQSDQREVTVIAQVTSRRLHPFAPGGSQRQDLAMFSLRRWDQWDPWMQATT